MVKSAVENKVTEVKAEKTKSILPSLEKYLKTNFNLGESWEHPVTHKEYSSVVFKDALKTLKDNDEILFGNIWMLINSSGNQKQFIARKLYVSASTLQRRWDKALNLLLLYILHPDLKPEVYISLSK
jgi:hypothetical protein